MKILCSLFLSILLSAQAFSQDRIITINGGEILGKVKEIDSVEIRYLPAVKDTATKSYTYGTTLERLRIADVFIIKYENGTRDVFSQNLPGAQQPAEDNTAIIRTPAQLYELGRQDATHLYDGTGAFLVGGLCGVTFGYGLLPAIVVAAVPPKPKPQYTSEPNLISDPNYTTGYKSKAHGRKALNVAGGFATGLLADVLLIAIFYDW